MKSQQPHIDLSAADMPADVAEQIARITENARRAQEQIDYLRSQPQYAEHDDSLYLGPAWDVLARRERAAIIQPPKPEITPAAAVLQHSRDRRPRRRPSLKHSPQDEAGHQTNCLRALPALAVCVGGSGTHLRRHS